MNRLCIAAFALLVCVVVVVLLAVLLPKHEFQYDVADVPRNDTAYNIRLVIAPSVSENHLAGIYRAVTRWQKIINGSLPYPETVSRIHLEQNCGVHINETELVIDDIVIFISTIKKDGFQGVLGSATWCIIDGDKMPRVGVITIDSSDIDALARSGQLEAVMVHEIAHCLGFGTLWEIKTVFGYYSRQWVTPQTTNPPWFFERPNAQQAEAEVTGNAFGPFPQIDHLERQGTTRSHWSKDRYGPEMMTGYMDAANPAVSLLTIRAMADIGYEVDVTQADVLALSTTKRRLRQEKWFEC